MVMAGVAVAGGPIIFAQGRIEVHWTLVTRPRWVAAEIAAARPDVRLRPPKDTVVTSLPPTAWASRQTNVPSEASEY